MFPHVRMAETFLVYQTPVTGPDGTLYEARAVGDEMPGGGWQGRIEFLPLAGGPPIHTSRETTQPNRTDTEYWATGLTPVYLEGALKRALGLPLLVPAVPPQPSLFRSPAPSTAARAVEVSPSSVLNPFSVYEKGEALFTVETDKTKIGVNQHGSKRRLRFSEEEQSRDSGF